MADTGTINLQGATQAATPRPTTGTEGRVTPTVPDFGAVGVSFTQAAGAVGEAFQESDTTEAEAAIERLGGAIEQGETFLARESETQARSMVERIQNETGIQLTSDDQEVLTMAAEAGKRFTELEKQGPAAERRAQIRKARELRRLIQKKPQLAEEFRSLIWGNNSFLDDIGIADMEAQQEEQQRINDRVDRLANNLLDAGYAQVANMSNEEVLRFYEKSSFGQRQRTSAAISREAQIAKDRQDQGEAVTANEIQRFAEEYTPGATDATIVNAEEIVQNKSGQYPDAASRLDALDQLAIQTRTAIMDQFPRMTTAQFNQHFGWVNEITETYKTAASGGREAEEAQAQLDLIKAGNRLDLENRFGISTLETVGRLASDLEGTGLLDFAGQMQDGGDVVKDRLLELVVSVSQNPNRIPDAPKYQPGTDPKVVADQYRNFHRWAGEAMHKWDDVPGRVRSAVTGHISSSLERSQGEFFIPIMDQTMSLMANEDFRKVVESDEWVQFDARHRRSFDMYMDDIGNTARTIGLEGVAEPINSNGVLALQPASGLRDQDKINKIHRLSGRIENAVRSFAHLNGLEYEQASREFYQAYFAEN